MKVKVMIKLTHSITSIYSILECRVECRIRNEGRVNVGRRGGGIWANCNFGLYFRAYVVRINVSEA